LNKESNKNLVIDSPLTSIKEVINKNQYGKDENETLENSPYKKRENKTTLPHLNKFSDNKSSNVINLQSSKEQKEQNYQPHTIISKNTSKSIRKYESKKHHQHNYSHNTLSKNNNIVNLKNSSENTTSPIAKFKNSNLSPNITSNSISLGHSLKDFSLNPIHSHSQNSANFNAEPERCKVKIKVAFKSKAGNNGGKTKTNQDSCLVKLGGLKLENFNIFSVMDGHGSHGHFISNAIKAQFSEYIFKGSHYGINSNSSANSFLNSYKQQNSFNTSQTSFNSNLLNSIYSKISHNEYNLIKRCFQHCEASLAKSKYEVNFSGTTAVMVVQLDDILICGNCGDSRAIVHTTEGIKNLSLDHKPDNDGEKARIISSGGRVEKFNDGGEYIGPYRVWLKYEDYPGLAMSRSLGDFVAKSVGCSCIPEIKEFKINSTYEYMVIASDGVWEFLDNEAVCKLVQPFFYKNDPDGACLRLIEESSRLWKIVSKKIFNFLLFK